MKRLKQGVTLILCMALVCTFTIPVFAGNGFMNGGTFINNAGATFNNRGTFENYSAKAGSLINNGSFTGSGAIRLFTDQVFTGSGTFSQPPARYYTVNFNSNGVAAYIPSQSVITGSYAVKPADPTRAGYSFDGWYSDAALTTAYAFNSTPVTSDLWLYPKWTSTSTGGSTTYTVTLPQTVISNTIESVTYTVQGVTGTYNSVSTSGTNNVYTVDANGLFKFTVTLNGTSYAMGPYTTAMINYNGTTGETVGVAERNNDWSALTCSITVDENKSGLGLDENLYQRITGTQTLTDDMGKVYIATGGTLNWTSSVNASEAQIYNYGTMMIGTEDATVATHATFYGTLNNYGQVTNANAFTLYVGQTGKSGFVNNYGTFTNNGTVRVVSGQIAAGAGGSIGGGGNIYSGETGTMGYDVLSVAHGVTAGGGYAYAISQDSSASNTWQFAALGTAAAYRVSVNSDTITAGEVYTLADDPLTTGVTNDYKATLFTSDSYYTKTTITVKTYDATSGLLTPDGGDGNIYKINSDTSSIYDVSGTAGTTMGARVTTMSTGDQLTVIYYVNSSDNSRVISDAWLTARGT